MHFGDNNVSTPEANASHPLSFAPTAPAITLAKARQLADSRPHGKGLNCRDIANDFEVHAIIVPNNGTPVNQTLVAFPSVRCRTDPGQCVR